LVGLCLYSVDIAKDGQVSASFFFTHHDQNQKTFGSHPL